MESKRFGTVSGAVQVVTCTHGAGSEAWIGSSCVWAQGRAAGAGWMDSMPPSRASCALLRRPVVAAFFIPPTPVPHLQRLHHARHHLVLQARVLACATGRSHRQR